MCEVYSGLYYYVGECAHAGAVGTQERSSLQDLAMPDPKKLELYQKQAGPKLHAALIRRSMFPVPFFKACLIIAWQFNAAL